MVKSPRTAGRITQTHSHYLDLRPVGLYHGLLFWGVHSASGAESDSAEWLSWKRISGISGFSRFCEHMLSVPQFTLGYKKSYLPGVLEWKER